MNIVYYGTHLQTIDGRASCTTCSHNNNRMRKYSKNRKKRPAKRKRRMSGLYVNAFIYGIKNTEALKNRNARGNIFDRKVCL